MSTPKQIDALRLRQIIEACLRRELAPDHPLPRLEEDLIESGALDSMAWVGVIRCVETAANVPDLGARRVTGPENEFNLAAVATRAALKRARAKPADLDFLIVTSETSLGYPSLGAQLHSRLLARDTCGVLDVGGACLGLLNGFAVARSLIAGGSARKVLVVSADVHTHQFAPGRVPGEFGGLFGDGASAFVLAAGAASGPSPASYRLDEFIFGCAGAYAGAIRVGPATGPLPPGPRSLPPRASRFSFPRSPPACCGAGESYPRQARNARRDDGRDD